MATPASLTDKNLYAYCDNNPVMRKDEGGEFWLAVARVAFNVATTVVNDLISAKVTGQDYTPADMLASAVSGFLGGMKKGGILSGVFNAGYSMYKSYKDGAGLLEIAANGVLSRVSAAINADNLVKGTAKVAKVKNDLELDKLTKTVVDNTHGFGCSLVTSAGSQSMSINRYYKKSNAKKQTTKTFSKVDVLKRQMAARR